MEKREWLKEKQLMIYAKYGYWVTQSSLEEMYISDDKIVLEQIEALKELRGQCPKLAKDINSDLGELLINPNPTRIKVYNEQYATNMRNDVETEMIEILFWLSVFEGSGLTDKQRQLLIDVMEGYSYEGNMKNFEFMCKKILKAKGGNCMSDNKRKFSEEQLAKLFPNYYAKPQEYYDCYLNVSRKLDCYIASVEQSKIRMDKIRQLSLKTSILPLTLECKTSEEI